MSEFSFKEGKVRSGLFSALGAAVKYVVVPLIIFTIVAAVITAANEQNHDLGLTMISDMRNAAVLLGIPIVFLSFFRGFYPKGSVSRTTFALLTTAIVCVWIWFVMRGGKFQISATHAELNLDISLLVLLFILAATLGGLYYVAEMFSYRKEYVTKKTALAPNSSKGPSAEQPKTEPAPGGQSPSEQPASPGSTD